MGIIGRFAVLAIVAVALVAPGASRADIVVEFGYTGGGPDISGIGRGSFSFADGLTSVSAADLKSFAFSATLTIARDNFPSTFTYGLADLSSFSATLGGGPGLAGLALATREVPGTAAFGFSPQYFLVRSLASGDASTRSDGFIGTIASTVGTVTITSVTASAVPEPASLALVGLGLSGIGLAARRRRNPVA